MGFIDEQIKKVSVLDNLNRGWVTLFFFWIVTTFLLHSITQHFWMSLADSTIIMFGCLAVLLLFNSVLIKNLLDKGHGVAFYLVSVLSVVIMTALEIVVEFVVDDFLFGYRLDAIHPRLLFAFLARMFILGGVATSNLVSHFRTEAEKAVRQFEKLESEKLELELHYLNAQINPHFLFNALNNIYSLVYSHDDKASDSVLRLSEMLRYVMVDCQSNRMPLKKEIDYIDNYIDFQIITCERRPDVLFEKKIENPNCLVPPMIFQPIVENSFKHSDILTQSDGFVRFELEQDGDSLSFMAKNSMLTPTAALVTNDDRNGIGLMNIRKRLDLYFGNDYSLETEQNDNVFRVELRIKRLNKTIK